MQFTPRKQNIWDSQHIFDRVCSEHAIVRRFHYGSPNQLHQHLADFIAAYNFARRVTTLRGLTPYEAICKAYADEPQRFPQTRTTECCGQTL